MKVIHNINPIFDNKSKVLILGTMPSKVSRENCFYYSNKNNRFWKVMECIFDIKLNSLEEKRKFLLDKKIAMWDTIYSCEIHASSDASIKDVVVNDINMIIKVAPIKAIITTGKKAYEILNKYIKLNKNIKVICLPSPSSANARFSLEMLLSEYKIIKDLLKEDD